MMCPGQPTPREWLDSLPKDDPIGRTGAVAPSLRNVAKAGEVLRDRRIGTESGPADWMKPGVAMKADASAANAERIRFAAAFVRDTLASKASAGFVLDSPDVRMLHRLLEDALND